MNKQSIHNRVKQLSLITFFIISIPAFGQKPTAISGIVVDENGKPVTGINIHFHGDTAHTDSKGNFKIAYPNPQQFFYALHFEKDGFFPKTELIGLSESDIVLKQPVTLRSRKAFWFDKTAFRKTDLGITVKEAIDRFKFDTTECIVFDEPPGLWYGFQTELADSSPVLITFKGFFSTERLHMSDILDLKITGIGITDMNNTEIIIGNAFAPRNLYLQERYIREENAGKKR